MNLGEFRALTKDLPDWTPLEVEVNGLHDVLEDEVSYDLYSAKIRSGQVRLFVAAIDEEPGDDLCDLCMTSGVNVDRTTYCGKTIGIECGCEDRNQDGVCGNKDCEDCYEEDKE